MEDHDEADATVALQLYQLCMVHDDTNMPELERMFREHPSAIFYRSKTHEQLLPLASRLGRLDIVNLFIQYGAGAYINEERKNLPLMQALSRKHTKVAKCLLNLPNIDINITNDSSKQGVTYLMMADLETAQILISRGAKVNVQDGNGFTALIHSAHGRFDLMKYLLSVGKADPNLQTNSGTTGLAFACLEGCLQSVKCLLQYGADPNLSNLSDGSFPLMCAARAGNYLITKWLLKFGAKINMHDFKGQTALMASAAYGHAAVASILLDHGADITIVSNGGETALTFAIKRAHFDVFDLLMEKIEQDPQAKDIVNKTVSENNTALHYAASCKYEHGRNDKCAYDPEGFNNELAVRFLLKNGANPHIRNNQNKLPFDLGVNMRVRRALKIIPLLLLMSSPKYIKRLGNGSSHLKLLSVDILRLISEAIPIEPIPESPLDDD